jgi:uncharacterized membrane protein YjjP (DUF1212 family)
VRREASAAPVEFLLGFARAGHDAGYTTAELEERVLVLADAVGLGDVQVSATPTAIELALGPLVEQRTYALRVLPAGVDLGAIARLDAIVRDVVDAPLDAQEALARLEEAHRNTERRSLTVVIAAYALAGAAVTPMLGGGWREAAAAALVGLAVACVALPVMRSSRTEPAVAPLAGAVASLGAAVAARFGLGASSDIVTPAALVAFLPGMTLAVGVRELATEQLQSGVANTAKAVVQLLGLVFGVEIGRSIASASLAGTQSVVLHPGPVGVELVAALAAGLAFTVRLQARSRDAPIMCSATLLALLANLAGTALLGKQAGVFGAAFVVGIAGGLLGGHMRRSPLVFIVPGVFMLVPGSASFNTAVELLSKHAISGVTAAVDTMITAISIAYGLMISAVIVPRGFTLPGRRRQGPRPAPVAREARRPHDPQDQPASGSR